MTGPAALADPSPPRSCRHPVAFGADLTDKPAQAGLLGEPPVPWRPPRHVKFDAVAVAYRKVMRGCGLTRS